MLEMKRNCNVLPVNWVGWIVYFLMPTKYSIAQKNIEQVFHGLLSAYEKKRIAIAYYSHIFLCIKELFLMNFLTEKSLEKRVKLIGVEHLYNALKKENGVLILTGHLGNWEFAPLFSLNQVEKGAHHYYCVRKALRLSFLNSIFWGRFEKAGFKIINKNNALAETRLALRTKNVVFFPFDLRPPCHSKSSLSASFLGQPSKTYGSIAYLAHRLNCAVLSVSFYRLNKKQHIIEFYPEIPSDASKDKKQAYLENTEKYNKRLEEMLLAYPEQWLWSYKRW
ncbi:MULTISPECIES: lysophospholipid acyltransferase family protein [Legionella]|uniref:Lipid A biosynthesis lauroyl acyltransferase n=1 Tax=Legionella steelei TaxID=947033 RepID=A0A0W0ZJF4_9GAMM|nr:MULTISPECIES: lysophospholipid acyltransferase family protein [Legionella]KTD69201.1 lipid A biosynthesis lauroyl acyltransferase [Legionella steelei]MBN9228922.1 lysophospholipid acyltransferase family protein [Legionella steelei]OJW06920.1 MAG: lipid A biosynthesis acyltransferase [Legionella sp. 39-23]